jgi:hypothetical protein
MLPAGLARAQSSDNKAAAQALFDEGRHLMDQKNYADACKKFEGSQKLDPGAGTLLNLADCYERNGQIASAWVTYKDGAAASGDRHPDWVQRAEKKAAELQPHLSKLTIVVTAVANLEVKRDGQTVAPTALGSALPVDPGPHTIEARAPGYTAFTTTVTIGADNDAQTVTIPALVSDGSGGGVSTAPSSGGTQRIIGGVLIGTGVVGVAIGTVFGIIALGKKSDASDPALCSSDFTMCTQQGKNLVDDAKSAGLISTVGLIAGGIFVAGGLVVVLTAPKSQRPLQAAVGAPGAPLGLSLGGAF